MLKIICCDGHNHIMIPVQHASISSLFKTILNRCDWNDNSNVREIKIRASMEELSKIEWYFHYCGGRAKKCLDHMHNLTVPKWSIRIDNNIMDKCIHEWLNKTFNYLRAKEVEDAFFRCLKCVSYLGIECLESQMIVWYKYHLQRKVTLHQLLNSFHQKKHLPVDS